MKNNRMHRQARNQLRNVPRRAAVGVVEVEGVGVEVVEVEGVAWR